MPETLALAWNDTETFADALAAPVTFAAKSSATLKHDVMLDARSPLSEAACEAMSLTEVATNLNCAATWTSTGRFASSVVLSAALPVTVTATDGLVQVALMDAELLQLALQSAAASQEGALRATSQLGAVTATLQPPVHLPLQSAVAPADAVQEPWHVPEQLPLHWPLAVVACPVPELAAPVQSPLQVPSHVPVHEAATVASTVHSPVQLPEHVPLRWPGSHCAEISGAVQLTLALHLPWQSNCALALTSHLGATIETFTAPVPAAVNAAEIFALASSQFFFTCAESTEPSPASPDVESMISLLVEPRSLAIR